VIVHGSRDSGELRSAFEEIRALAPASTMEIADLADDNAIGAMFKRCIRVDALINNAATQNPSPFVGGASNRRAFETDGRTHFGRRSRFPGR
jgi:short-subunit dehydrogenase